MIKIFSSTRRWLLLWKMALAIIFIASFAQLSAHPHVFIEGQIKPNISQDGTFFQGIEVRWLFDEIYSAQMIFDFDSNRNGKIDASEEQQIYRQSFMHLKEYDYFVCVKHQGEKNISHLLGSARNFRSFIKDNKLAFQFYLPFDHRRTNYNNELTLASKHEYLIYLEDQEYFIAFASQLFPDLVANKGVVTNKYVILENKEFEIKNPAWGSYYIHAVSMKTKGS